MPGCLGRPGTQYRLQGALLGIGGSGLHLSHIHGQIILKFRAGKLGPWKAFSKGSGTPGLPGRSQNHFSSGPPPLDLPTSAQICGNMTCCYSEFSPSLASSFHSIITRSGRINPDLRSRQTCERLSCAEFGRRQQHLDSIRPDWRVAACPHSPSPPPQHPQHAQHAQHPAQLTGDW